MKKVAIITGGSSGIGKSLVEVFAKNDYGVFFTGRDADRLNSVQSELREAIHEDIYALQLDAESEQDNQQLVQEALKLTGFIDVLVCNAGISMRALFEDLDLSVFKKVMDINFQGALFLTKAALPHLIKSQGGIVAISSINGLRSTPARSAYSASKFAMEGFFETLRTELMKKHVHVLVVNPGFTQSRIRIEALNEKGNRQGHSPKDESKMMTPTEVAKRTFDALKKKKRRIILTRTGRWLNRLNFYFPSYIDRIVYKVFTKEPDSPLK